ncbi:MAG TPA: hypothetical protein VHE59_18345 [Mucilaginibacter sp.]|nr:hypothetical protein [Mucilaginibacter sp.]
MEVHHHPEVEKKGFKEYLLEGLMIFLAVMLGFFAESIREHIADKHRENEYMASMVEDLKSDTVIQAKMISYVKVHNAMIDSLIQLLTSPSVKEKGNDIYYFARNISIPTRAFYNDRTIQQLKSSGSLRLISRVKISDDIMAYDQKIREQYFDMADGETIRESYRQLAIKVFDSRVFNTMQRGDRIIRPVDNPSLFSSDPAILNAYIGSAQYLKKFNENSAKTAGNLLGQAKRLIGEIKDQYPLDE